MCGIVAVLARSAGRPVPALDEITGALTRGTAALEAALAALHRPDGHDGVLAELGGAADHLTGADRALRGVPGLGALLAGATIPTNAGAGAGATRPRLPATDQVETAAAAAAEALAALDAELDGGHLVLDPTTTEAVNAALLPSRDAIWAVGHDRVGAARAVAATSPLPVAELDPAARTVLWSVEVALGALDRLEVRGRDSAGLHLLIGGHGLDPDDTTVAALLAGRTDDALFCSGAARTPAGGQLSLVYKAAAEIGELGDNVRALRAAIAGDALLTRALRSPDVTVTVLGHTRWASVGIISEANAHPLNSDEVGAASGPYVTAALNGDVDNHADLRTAEALELPVEVTTDAKVIPALVSRRLATGEDPDQAFSATVARFEGSVAIAASLADTPDRLHLALRGSGQSLNIGLAEDAFVVASEAYGLVEHTDRYLRMDGEATRGQTVVLDRSHAGLPDGITRARYDGGTLPVVPDDLVTASITTRDVHRGDYPHFLLKEISEAPQSFRKTLRGRVLPGPDGRLAVVLGDEALPPAVAADLAAGRVRRILVIGQGTAAVAGQAVAAALARCLPALPVTALPATELSGFGLTDDMGDTLVVAVSQSGTTTDTNRTVDLVRGRGASVLAVVNRRSSDLVTKAHGVLYTSDGRDVEMSVASTKAFYAQVAAGWLLALGLADAAGVGDPETTHRILTALRELPAAMEAVLADRDHIARVAAAVAPPKRYWAVVGNGPDRVAASEIRIKLSELCYKSIASDATEDKKHIDLSSEPLILVCAAGLHGPNAGDVAKEVAIYRAHKAVPVVVAPVSEAHRFTSASDVIEVPDCEPDLAFVLAAMVGHLFGYEAALAIDAQARPLRQARAAIEEAAGLLHGGQAGDLLTGLAPLLADVTAPFDHGIRDRSYDGHLEASTAVRLVSLLRYATGILPVEGYEVESGKVGAPSTLVVDLFDALSEAIDQLTRPVDAIKHQAKTVTVGISRNEDALLAVPLVAETLAAGPTPDLLGYRALRTLACLDPAVVAVTGYTRYRIEWGRGTDARVAVVDQGGSAQGITSRTSTDARLRGTKHRAADEREVTVARGRSDGRTVVLVPEVKANAVVGMTLLHVRFADHLDVAATQSVLSGYRDRYSALRDAVTETEPTFDDEVLGRVGLVELLTEPVNRLADRWHAGAG